MEAIQKRELIAFLYNFYGLIKTENMSIPINEHFKSTFFKPQKNLEDLFEGQIQSV